MGASPSRKSALAARIPGLTKPGIVVAIYANPDMYPPTRNAIHILDRTFNIRIVSRNTAETVAVWPRDVEVQRVGPPLSPRALEAASAFAKVRGFARYLIALRRAIVSSKPRFIYAYDPLGFAAAMLARTHGVPIIFHCHDVHDFERLSIGSLQSWLTRYALKRTREAECVVFPEAKRAALWLEAAGDERAPVIVPNGASRNFFCAPRDWQTLADERFKERLALYMGWIGAEHGELNAIRAIGVTTSAKLAMIGSPPSAFQAVLRKTISESHAADRVELHSWSDERRKRLLEVATLGLIVYRPFSTNLKFVASAVVKLFEYAAAGLPVVAPIQGNYREFLGNERWVVFADVEDPRSIARAIEVVLRDRDRYLAMSHAAREAHEKRFNYETLFQPVKERLLAIAGRGLR